MRHSSHLLASLALLASPLLSQGPLVLMGIDAEDGGPGAHGPIAVYETVISNGGFTGILNNVTNGGAGILVIGGGKNPADSVTTFWNQIDADLGPGLVTYVNGAGNITAQSFAGFAMLAIVSDQFNTPGGGLTNAENNALTTRAGDVANFINGGGGLLGFSSCQLSTPYGYLGSVGAFTCVNPPQFSNITPTAEGLAIGITNQLDICCWHDEYSAFPGFLDVLATNATTGQPCAIGGQQVIIVQGIVVTPLIAVNEINTNHTFTATVADNMGNPVVGTNVTFNIIAGGNTGVNGAALTDAGGQAQFTYSSSVVTIDTVEACFIDNMGASQCATAIKEWVDPPECYMFIGLEEGALPLGPELDDVVLVLPLVIIPVTTVQIPTLWIPNDPGLLNATVSAQVAMFNPVFAPTNPLQLSNGLRLVLGNTTESYGQNAGIVLMGNAVPYLGQNYMFWFTIAP